EFDIAPPICSLMTMVVVLFGRLA
ncbi:hypothetical protein A2U01_0116189, partial [Trifolium medium]|nr:hypothetical protein [Trifolium medium]